MSRAVAAVDGADLVAVLSAAGRLGAGLNQTWRDDVASRMRAAGRIGPDDTPPDKAVADFVLGEEVQRIATRREAHRLLDRIEAGPAQPFDAGTLGELLVRDPEPPHRVAGLIPSEAATLIVAQRKTGKTTLMLNLARSLIGGRPFLGRFDVRPIDGNVALLNFEVSGPTAARWADEHGVDRDRLVIVNLRGRRNPFDHPDDRERLAALLRDHDVETLLVDPFGRAYSGTSQNDSGEVGAWLVGLDRFARDEAGVLDLALTAHAGWEGERTRGASALEDWADSVITLVRGKDDDVDGRYLRAIGRDVDIEEDRLAFGPDTRTLTLTGAGSREKASSTARASAAVPAVVEAVTASPGISGNQLTRMLRDAGEVRSNAAVVPAAKLAIERGLIRVEQEPGGRRTRRYYPMTSPTSPDLPTTSPAGTSPDLPYLLSKGEVGRSVREVGPCAKCGDTFPGRYGIGGNPWCPRCRAGG